MKKILLFILSLNFFNSTAQETELILNKIDQNKFNIDGVVSNEEINKAKILDIIYEAEPGLNSMPSQETTGYITYSDKFLYVGIKGKRERVIAPLTTRDNSVLFRGDFAGITIDSYGDARNNMILISNPSGSQTDGIRLPGTSFGGGPNINLNANFDFQSSGRITDEGYEIEFLIPFSELPFPNGKNQSWKFELFTGYIDDENEGVEVRAGSSMSSREASCQLCLLDHIIVMDDIVIDKKLDFLPYVSSNISGSRDKYYDRINYETPESNYGIGVNLELN